MGGGERYPIHEQMTQVARITGVAAARAYVDGGDRGHNAGAEEREIFICREKRAPHQTTIQPPAKSHKSRTTT
jgi:hypothetical protein